MKTYMFPGQGSQRKGMGEGLFDRFPAMTNMGDSILGYSIKDLCLNDPEHKLNKTQYTQPAMYIVNALSYVGKTQDTGEKPDFLTGHSLGEYNALQAAGVFSFEDGVRLVKKRGELMGQARNGGMAAIINSTENEILKILQDANLSTIDIANLNSSAQIVISGLKEDINNSQQFFEKAKIMFIPLNTNGAFHSRYMEQAEKEFKEYVDSFTLLEPQIPVISNVTATPYDSKAVVQNLTRQITSSVRWNDSVMYLLEQGDMEFWEVGIGDVLTKLVVSIKRDWASARESSKELPEQKVESGADKVENSNPIVKAADISEEPMPIRETAAKISIPDCDAEKTTALKNPSLNGQELVERWNQTYSVGKRVTSDIYDIELETKTEAILLFGHRAAVYMKGYNGYFDLREVTPVNG